MICLRIYWAKKCLPFLLLWFAVPGFAQDWPQSVGFVRAAEDYSFLGQDQYSQTNLLERLKYLPLGKRANRYLTLGFNLRHQYEIFLNNNWGSGPQDETGWWLQRYMLYADLHWGQHLRFFGQTRTALFHLNSVAPNPTQQDEFDIHQAFVTLYLWRRSTAQLSLQVGRQELWYGARRLIGIREGPNVRQSFDLAKINFQTQDVWNIDALYAQFVPSQLYVLDNVRDNDQEIWGGYATRKGQPHHFDLYYLGNRFAQTAFDEDTVGETRHSVGIRWWNESGPLQWNNEAIYQFGRYGSGSIAAWTASFDVSYQFSGRVGPQLGLRTEVISGDAVRGDGHLQTFNALYPRGAYFGLIALIGPANLIDVHPIYRMTLADRLGVLLDYDFFWRYSRQDGVYGPNVALVRSSAGTSSRFVGHQPGFELAWGINRYLEWTLEGSYFVTGPFFTESEGADDNVWHFVTQFSFKF